MTRDELVESAVGVAEECANRFIARLPKGAGIDEDAIRGACRLALVNAAGRYDPARGLQFSTFVWPRLWGAMRDELRASDHLTRTDRTVHKTVGRLEQQLRRPPTDEETADASGVSLAQVTAARSRPAGPPLRLDEPARFDDEDSDLTLIDAFNGGGSEFADTVCDTLAVREAVAKLPRRQQLILSLRFHDGLTNVEIGEMFGVSESRISQIVSTAVMKLRRELQRVPQPAVRRAAA